MLVIYEPKGKALEYCERAANLYRGCGHGCLYCYAPGALRMKHGALHNPKPRPGVLTALAKDAPKHAGRECLLCFTTDPYHPASDDTTREAIRILQASGCRVTILTKGGKRSERDFDLLRPGVDRYGASLTLISPTDSGGRRDPGQGTEGPEESRDQGPAAQARECRGCDVGRAKDHTGDEKGDRMKERSETGSRRE